MLAIILDRTSQEKAELLKRLDRRAESTFSINQLALESGVNYRKLDRLAAEIDQDFQQLGWQPFLVKKGLVLWTSNGPLYSDYIRFLIRSSLGWQLLLNILLDPGMPLVDFCGKMYSSRSTVLRRMKPLVDYFRKIGIELSPTKMTLEGEDEERIQLLLFTFVWYGSYGSELLAAVADCQKERQVVAELYRDTAPALNDQVGLVSLLVARLRLEAGYSLPESRFPRVLFPEKLQLLQEYFTEICPDAYGWADRQAASLYYKMLAVPFLSRFDFRTAPTSAAFADELAAGCLPAVLAEGLLRSLTSRFFPLPIDPEKRRLTVCNLHAVLRSIEDPKLLPPIQLQCLLPESVYELEVLKKIEVHCHDFLQAEKERRDDRRLASRLAKEALPVTLAETIYPLLSSQRYRFTVKVGLERMPNFNMLTDLLNFLDQLHFVEYEICRPNQAYDFYIGLTPEHLPKDRPNYLVSFQGQDHRGELFQRLLNELQKKSLQQY